MIWVYCQIFDSLLWNLRNRDLHFIQRLTVVFMVAVLVHIGFATRRRLTPVVVTVGLAMTNLGSLFTRDLQKDIILRCLIPFITWACLSVLTFLFFVDLLNNITNFVWSAGTLFTVHTSTLVSSAWSMLLFDRFMWLRALTQLCTADLLLDLSSILFNLLQ